MSNNVVHKHAHKYNKPAVHKDRKKALKKGYKKHKEVRREHLYELTMNKEIVMKAFMKELWDESFKADFWALIGIANVCILAIVYSALTNSALWI